jgi:DNA-binding response OmpR family regulator
MRAITGDPPLRIAVLDGDTGFVSVLAKRFEDVGYRYWTLEPSAPVEQLVALRLDAVVVDVAYAGAEPVAYLESLCGRFPELGVIVCTGPSSVGQRVRALRLCVDDWLTKPCHAQELVARAEAVMRRRRRTRVSADQSGMHTGEVEIRPDLFQAYAGGVSLGLTRREYELIAALAEAEGRLLEREEIYLRVWGYTMARGDRSVDVYVRKLRLKLERASPGWRYIHTHFGIGYRFAPVAPERPAQPRAESRTLGRVLAETPPAPTDNMLA